MNTPVRVMVIDDSAVVRQVLTGLLSQAPGIEVMAAVADPVLAIERLKLDWPDVIVLDVDAVLLQQSACRLPVVAAHVDGAARVLVREHVAAAEDLGLALGGEHVFLRQGVEHQLE